MALFDSPTTRLLGDAEGGIRYRPSFADATTADGQGSPSPVYGRRCPESLPLASLAPSSGARTHITSGSLNASGRSEEHTSELQSLMRISYAVFCLKKKKPKINTY